MFNIIKFVDFGNIPEEYRPLPASKMIPSWYKNIESRIPNKKTPDSTPTIKKCMPVFDAITAGYIIVSYCDVYVSIKDGEPSYQSAVPNAISFHPRKQAYNHPLANEYMFPKWMNQWGIKTPRGWSCYFKPLAHNPNPWFEIMEGVVDTDLYTSPVNFPFVLKETDKEFLIPAGTPIAQVIPFKRSGWKMQVVNKSEKYEKSGKLLETQFFDRYKKMFWSKKTY